ncbi:AfsR/SARP family transcriptional regulator [Umezawaea beigongshangensis]|uniref:AfsR/SARP family transcriptional regulator n=1 Tax=Umezawaea beigongshangensis TaxID=2780383 RepID=UPI0018F23732|nr:BTAD domain-containing putative transcriptional regulator [Umezawaea beigongshangensis]
MDVRFSVLGTTKVKTGGGFVDAWGAPKERAVLGVLLVHAGKRMSTGALVDWVWGEDADLPQNPADTLATYAKRIRRALGGLGVRVDLSGRDNAFAVVVPRPSVDFFSFREQVERGRVAAAGGDHRTACELLQRALRTWTEQPLADVRSTAADTWRRRVEENVRLPAWEALFESQLALGQHHAVLTAHDDLGVEDHTHLGLLTKRLEALHGLARAAEATEHFLAVHRRLREDADDAAADALRRVHDVLVRRSADPAGREARRDERVVPHQLPHHFPDVVVGREVLVSEVDAVTTREDGEAKPCVVVLHGLGGVGKTALAVHWALNALDRFPDGDLFVDLDGFAEGPGVEAAVVVDRFLEGLGHPPERLPNPDARANKLAALLSTRRVLVVLDNARGSDQVERLMPLLSRSVVVITSRSKLTGLGFRYHPHQFQVDPLDGIDARRLLASGVGARAVGEPRSLEALADLCSGLPIALKVLAQHIAARPGAPLSDFLRQVNEDVKLLDIGAAGDGVKHGLRAVFDQSVRALGDTEQRLYRLLALHPGPDVTVAVAAALMSEPAAVVRSRLDVLAEAHLLEQPGLLDRYQFHDLLREHAAALIADERYAVERRAAEQRVLDHYFRTAANADVAVFPHHTRVLELPPVGDVVPLTFPDASSAMRWCNEERLNLNAVIAWAAAAGHLDYAAKLPHVAGEMLKRMGHFDDALAALGVALRVARATGDVLGEAYALHNAGNLHLQRKEFGLAEERLHEATLLFSRLSHEEGVASSVHNGARVLVEVGDLVHGIDAHERALLLVRRTRASGLEALFLCRTGEAHRLALDHRRAAERLEEGLELAREIGDPFSEAIALAGLAALQLDRERPARAREFAFRALSAVTRTRDAETAARALLVLSRADLQLDDLAEAVKAARRAVHLFQRSRTTGNETDALDVLARALLAAGRLGGAEEAWESAKALSEDDDAHRAARFDAELARLRAVAVPEARPSELPAGRAAERDDTKHR